MKSILAKFKWHILTIFGVLLAIAFILMRRSGKDHRELTKYILQRRSDLIEHELKKKKTKIDRNNDQTEEIDRKLKKLSEARRELEDGKGDQDVQKIAKRLHELL